MRLTLRTLLAWHDGVLPPEEQRQFGERVAASNAATQLATRIRSAVGHDALAAPRIDAWGAADDANSVAAYLDNRLPAEQIELFERTCLESDVQLAEVGACHGMLADLVHTPALQVPPPTDLIALLKQRAQRALPTPPSLRETIAASAAAEAIAAAAPRPRLGAAAPAEPLRVGRAATAHAGASLPATPSREHLRPPAAVADTPAVAAPAAVGEGGHEPDAKSGGGLRRRLRARKTAKSPGESARSERLLAAGSLLALLAVGGLLVTWFGPAAGPRGPQRASLQGEVTFDGKPLESGVIVLVPTGGTQGPTAGGTLADGKFHITAAAGPVIGRYRVEIKATRKTDRAAAGPAGGGADPFARKGAVEPTEQFIPSRYNTASELEVDIKPGRNRMTFDLTSPPQSDSRPGGRGPQQRLATGRPGPTAVAVPVPNRAG